MTKHSSNPGFNRPLILTAGEPAGIGPELCVALAHEQLPSDIVVVSDPDLLQSRAELAGIDVHITEIEIGDDPEPPRNGELHVIATRFPEAVVCGQLNPANAATILDGLRLAVDGCVDGRFAGIVTAPVQKSVINDAGFAFSGHTEFLAQHTNSALPVMLLVANDLRVALASTHSQALKAASWRRKRTSPA